MSVIGGKMGSLVPNPIAPQRRMHWTAQKKSAIVREVMNGALDFYQACELYGLSREAIKNALSAIASYPNNGHPMTASEVNFRTILAKRGEL